MCGRFYLENSIEDELEKTVKGFAPAMLLSRVGDVHPADTAPVIERCGADLRLAEKRWGYPSPSGKGLIINARSESVMQKAVFAAGISRGRIVIPASGFYEWNKNKEKNTFSRTDSGVLYMAGIYDWFNNEERFVILTTAANESMIKVHSRMPLILEKEQLSDWIWDDKAVQDILHQIPVQLKREAEFEQLSWF